MSQDFVNDLTDEMLRAMPDINTMWAEICALMPLSTFLPNATIHDKEGPMHLNLFSLGVGPAGIKKTLPMFGWTQPLIKRTGDLINRDFLLPNRSSVPGFIDFISAQNKQGFYIRNQGIVVRDEFTGMFREMREAHWQNDALEFLSEAYDGTAQKRMTLKNGLKDPPDMYVNVLSATTFDFTNVMDYRFYKQGTGNRILYIFFAPEDYKVSKLKPDDYFNENCRYDYENIMKKYSKILEKVYRRNILSIGMSEEAGDLWVDYKYKCDMEWYTKLLADKNGWSFHPIRRYPEFALKLAGIYSVSEFIASLPPIIIVTERAMKRAISLVEKNKISFKEIVKMKTSFVPSKKVESFVEQAKTELMKLASSSEGMLNLKDWYATMDTTKNRNAKLEIKELCRQKEWIKVFEYNDLTPHQRKKYNANNSNSKVVKYQGDWNDL